MPYSYIERNYHALCEELSVLSARAGRPVTLVSVTKSGTDEELTALVRAGAEDLGENRPQELFRRAALLGELGLFPRMHEIGHLQKNKVKLVLPTATLIHSVDTVALAAEIERQAARDGRTVSVLLEINSGREAAKSGALPEEAEDIARAMGEMVHLRLCGLMTMAPVTADPEQARPYFRLTRRLFEQIGEQGGYATDAPILSMGMSDTYRVAIEEGSTLVRVGRRLFQKDQ